MAKESKTPTTQEEQGKICGIVRPIAGTSEIYSSVHWENVHDIIAEAATQAGFKPSLVSEANEVSVIHKTIINNLYNNDIVVVDISSKNPNVMFELGIRLTFDKPTVIVKDELTNYSFDTGIIEHISYPADLHYQSILKFKDKLASKIAATAENHNSFLKNFGEFKISQLEQKEVGQTEYIIKAIEDIKSVINQAPLAQYSKEQHPTLTSKELQVLKYWEKFCDELTMHSGLPIFDDEIIKFKNWMRTNYPLLFIQLNLDVFQNKHLTSILERRLP